MKRITYLILLFTTIAYPQKEFRKKMGQVTKEELQIKTYSKDSTANAVVLYEHANIYIDKNNNFDFRTDYYFRIKIINKESYNLATIKIPLLKKERIKEIKAVTYNLEKDFIRKKSVPKEKIFSIKQNQYWTETTLTLPNLKEGSVIEYSYSVLSPYSRIDDWVFQSSIPKIKSEIDITMLGNFKYKMRLTGAKKLDKNNTSIKKRCLNYPGLSAGGCIVYSYGMNNIPAFEEEDYMLSKNNFISKITFDLVSFTDTQGNVKRHTKTWADADKKIRRDFLDKQTSKKNYFKNKLPKKLLSIENDFERTQKIYLYLQEKLNWNNRYWTHEDLRIKKVFEENSGSVEAINLILYNSLKAANIECYLVALSTRKNGLPAKVYPIVKDFNYVLVKAVINGESYFLDATNKNLAFGQIPFKCLNGEGRVLDFKKGSYWEKLSSRLKSTFNYRIQLDLNEENNFKGTINIIKKGYFASNERALLEQMNEEEYLENFESENQNLEVEDYSHENLEDNNKFLKQKFKITIENDNENLKFNPFFHGKITVNPFKLNNRIYPVDYGYKRNYNYNLKIRLPEKYKVSKLPEEKTISLPNKGGVIIFKSESKNNQLNIYLKYNINKKTYSNEEYYYLKEFYNQLIKIYNTTIELIPS